VTRSIANSQITPDESDEICTWITHLVGDSATDTGIATFGNVRAIECALDNHKNIDIDQRMLVLKGKLTLGARKAIQGMIFDGGGEFKGTLCRNTHYLCVAAEASRDWKHSHDLAGRSRNVCTPKAVRNCFFVT